MNISTRRRARVLVALMAAALAVLASAGSAVAEGPGPLWHGGSPSGSGMHLALWQGGTIEQAAATPGARSLWASFDGQLHGYVVGGPAFVNDQFRARFAAGVIPAGQPMLLVLGLTPDASAEEVIEAFLADLESAAPPGSSEPALIRTLSRLTEATRSRLATSGQVAGFIGVQDLPDLGATLTLRSQTQARAHVHAVLHYTGGDAEREFLLLRERERWHIDWVDAHPVGAEASPEQVVHAFVAHFIASGPPAPTPHPAIRASELLTEAVREALPDDVPLASALAVLVGVQDVPDMGFDVATATVVGGQATVVVTLHYSGGDATRTFTLALEDGAWRIEAVGP